MRFHKRTLIMSGIAPLGLFLQQGMAQQATTTPAAPAGRGTQARDVRVQQRMYHFADTNEDLPYAVFVSSKVTKDKRNPLIIALHGLGGNANTLMHGNLLDLAEEGGYIVFAPAGYNPRGWYGIPWTIAPPSGAAPKAVPKADPAAANDPPNLSELAEKDAMNL
jgi:predicted alpha/beta-fold hydrolase